MGRVLLYGGSFDPIHNGHLTVCRAVAERLRAERAILIPAASPPHKSRQALSAGHHRLAMCRLAAEGDGWLEVSDWEIEQPGPNYTLLTVRHFQQMLGESAALYWLIGMDTLAELATWYRIGELAEECTFVTAARPGFAVPKLEQLQSVLSARQIKHIQEHILDTPEVDISASRIRALVAASRPIAGLVPDAVRAYIAAHDLYAGT